MKYILESRREFDRLEEQSSVDAWDYKRELANLDFSRGKILDAGSGSGIVTRYLAQTFPQAEVVGCDLSPDRVELASEAGRHFKNLKFQTEDLTQLTFETSTFDAIVSRYVLEHLPPTFLEKALVEFHRILKPGALLQVIDVDGYLKNMYPQTSFVRECMQKIIATQAVDIDIGRKLPTLMKAAGFENISWKIETQNFTNESLKTEAGMIAERFANAAPMLAQVFGGMDLFLRFTKEIQESLATPESVLFYSKFIVSARKPGNTELRRIK